MTPADMTGNELDFNAKRKKKNMKRQTEQHLEDFFDDYLSD